MNSHCGVIDNGLAFEGDGAYYPFRSKSTQSCDVAYVNKKLNKKGDPPFGRSPIQVQLSRISAQHHRCNGKSIHCPSNVPVIVTIYLCGLLLCSVVLVLTIMLFKRVYASPNQGMSSSYRKW
jgi:hypothetical protein